MHPDQEIRHPTVTGRLDFGVELVAVVARRLGGDPQATACLLGYTTGNGISARNAGGDVEALDLFTRKALDRTAAVGPWVTTLDEFGRGQPQTNITMRVNGEVRQLDHTGNMIFIVDELLNFIDVRVALQPGDLVFTGTPSSAGVEEGRLLQPGDRLASEIDRIGVLRNVVGPREQPPAVRLGARNQGFPGLSGKPRHKSATISVMTRSRSLPSCGLSFIGGNLASSDNAQFLEGCTK